MKKWGYGIAGAAMALIVGTLSTGAAAPAEPGSTNDPLVTKSYVEQVKSELLSKISSIPAAPSGGSNMPPADNAQPSSGKIATVKLESGQEIIGYSGTEFIVRSGKVTALTQEGKGYSLPDITTGTDLLKDEKVSLNHLILMPRDDGRGLNVVQGPAYIMVRGAYKIQ
jgi:hypothetical protein